MDDFKSFVYQKIQKLDFAIRAKCVVHFRPAGTYFNLRNSL